MKKRTLAILIVLILATLACNFPRPGVTPTPQPTPEGMQVYYGKGMNMLLPPSYVATDVQEDLPNIIQTLTSFIGSGDGPLSQLLDNLEDNISWWGYDSASPAVYPTKLMIVKNKTLAALPISITALALEQIVGNDSNLVDQDSITLGGRDMTRFTYSQENNAWAAYAFKEESHLWLAIFITTPANLGAEQFSFEQSVSSIVIDPIP